MLVVEPRMCSKGAKRREEEGKGALASKNKQGIGSG